MIRINLLPFRAARTKENVRRQISIFILIILLMFVAMAAMTIHLNSEKSKKKQMVETVQKELLKYTKKAKEVDRLEKESKTLQQKIDIITKLEDVRKEPVVIFTALTDVHVSERMWLSSFNTKDQSISISGTALDEITVADYTKKLQLSDAFTDVTLKFLKHDIKEKVAVKKFEISCNIGKIKKEITEMVEKGVK